jgi:Trk-type K+ transport system membrane component
MDPIRAIGISYSLATLLLLWTLVVVLFGWLRTDALRESLCVLRDQLFDIAVSQTGFHNPDYKTLRYLLDEAVSHVHTLTFARLMLARVILGPHPQMFPRLTKGGADVVAIHEKFRLAIARSLVVGSPILWVVCLIRILLSGSWSKVWNDARALAPFLDWLEPSLVATFHGVSAAAEDARPYGAK